MSHNELLAYRYLSGSPRTNLRRGKVIEYYLDKHFEILTVEEVHELVAASGDQDAKNVLLSKYAEFHKQTLTLREIRSLAAFASDNGTRAYILGLK